MWLEMTLNLSRQISCLTKKDEGKSHKEEIILSKPVIATRFGAIPDMLADGSGVLIDLEDLEEIVIALKTLIADDGRNIDIGNNFYRKLCNEYTIETVFDRYMQEWEKLSE